MQSPDYITEARAYGRIALACAAFCALAACATGPDYHSPSVAELGVPGQFTNVPPAERSEQLARWWDQFKDPKLKSLIDLSLATNLDIAQAATRLRQARAALSAARADLLPSVSGSAGAGRNFDNKRADNDSVSAGLDAQWEVDLFGGLRRSVEASRADLQAAGYDLATVQTAIAAEIARNYVLLRQSQERLAIARDVLGTQDENLEIAGWRVRAGLVSSLDVEQARSQRAQTAASIPPLQQAIANAINRLSVLSASPPGALREELGERQPIPVADEEIAVGIPADTLRNRPDVRLAERQLAAASARIGVAKAQLFPALSINGNVGSSALNVGRLGDVITGGLFATLSQIIFDGGRRAASIRSQQAATDGAFANYRQTVLVALEDVENGLAALASARDRQIQLGQANESAQLSAILARSQYRAGLTDFQTLLEAERQLLSARDSLVNARADETISLIQLYTALGGGWNPDAPPSDGRSS